jgi:ferredoxin--NADP+ reductase
MPQWIEARVVDKTRWTPHLWSLRLNADIAPFKAGQFITLAMDIDGKRVARPYSLVNAPTERPLEVYFNIVPEGPLSARLAALEAGDSLWVKDAASGLMTLDQVPECANLWLLSTGTALGPFISMLKTEESWQRFENIILVHGVRHGTELTYREDLHRLQQAYAEQLQLVSFVSREKVEHAIHGRITTSIENRKLEEHVGVALRPEDCHVMLCGNAGMIADAQAILARRGMQRHHRRQPGHVTAEKYH